MHEFELVWQDWLLAGSNTGQCCMIGLEGCILDITQFLPQHPGSPETLLYAAGGDVTQFFNDIGHSYVAREMSKDFVVAITPPFPVVKGRGRLFSKQQIILMQKKTRILAQLSSSQNNKAQWDSNEWDQISTVAGHLCCIACSRGQHDGQQRLIFDPLSREWHTWWSCCGMGKRIVSINY